MNTADIAVIASTVVDLAAVGAAWHLVKTGRVRLSSPSVAQLQAEAPAAPETPATAREAP